MWGAGFEPAPATKYFNLIPDPGLLGVDLGLLRVRLDVPADYCRYPGSVCGIAEPSSIGETHF